MATRTRRSGKPSRKKPPAPRKVQAIPVGYEGVTPYLAVRGAARALDFYARAFGARVMQRLATPDGTIRHAEMKVFGRVVMLSEENPGEGRRAPESLGGTSVSLFAYSNNVDAAMARAQAAGATVAMPAQDMFWGDRFGTLTDPFGHTWQLATHREDVSPREMHKRFQAMMAGGPK